MLQSCVHRNKKKERRRNAFVSVGDFYQRIFSTVISSWSGRAFEIMVKGVQNCGVSAGSLADVGRVELIKRCSASVVPLFRSLIVIITLVFFSTLLFP